MTRDGMAGFAVLLTAALTAGCGSNSSDRSVLYQGVQSRSGHAYRVSDAAAKLTAQRSFGEWQKEVTKRARLAPAQRFNNLSATVLRRRLHEEARRYRFRVVSLELLHPRQLAPKIVVRTTYYVALARAAGAILDRIDPWGRTAAAPRKWRYEGLYFEAQDERGIPFFVTYDFMRGRGPGGGQWARSEPLYPFAHG